MAADIMVFGTGNFAGRLVCDIAAGATGPVEVAVAGRNAPRLAWLRTAASARAVIFGRNAHFVTDSVDIGQPDALAGCIARHRPKVILQAASAQPGSVISAQDNRWSRLVAEGGLSVTAVFQAQFSLRVLQAMDAAGHAALFVNACFPDVVNALLTARGHPVACGIGNIGILSNAFMAEAGLREQGVLRTIGHYQTITPFRRPPAVRGGPMPRVWIGGEEIEDVASRFAGVQLTPEPALEISGACGVPLLLAMAFGQEWRGHVPGPNGLVGGYPVLLRDSGVSLDLPPGVSVEEAVRWNRAFEERNGLVVDPDGHARYSGTLHERLRAISPDLAEGFHVRDLEALHSSMDALRSRLQASV